MNTPSWARVAERLPPFLAGASAGLLVAWVLARPRAPAEPPLFKEGDGAAAATPRWPGAWDGALETLASATGRLLGGGEEIDLEALRARIRVLPEARDVEIRDLRGGIVEVLGHAEHADAVKRILDALAGAPGVSVVVNRVWTPSSLVPSS